MAPPKLAKQLSEHLGPLANNINTQVRNLDSELKFDRQVSAVVKGSFYQLRIIAKLKRILSFEDMETVIHAFISSRLDYCNSLYLGLSKNLLSWRQLVQNAQGSGPASLQCWLPVDFRIHYKVLIMVFKGLHGLAPEYISCLLQQHCVTRPLRSSQSLLLHVPRSRLKTKGDRAFSVPAPRLWNSLPTLHIRSCDSLDCFKSMLKTHLYSVAYSCP